MDPVVHHWGPGHVAVGHMAACSLLRNLDYYAADHHHDADHPQAYYSFPAVCLLEIVH